jgi:hypothetical protein
MGLEDTGLSALTGLMSDNHVSPGPVGYSFDFSQNQNSEYLVLLSCFL